MQIIGEAAARLDRDFHNAYPAIPWAAIVAMRNILVHDYLDIDSRLVHNHLGQRLSDFQQFSQELIEQFPTLRGEYQAPQ